MKKELLRKVRILSQLDKASYLAEDLLDGSEVQAYILGKMRMFYIQLHPGDIIYIIATSDQPNRGRLIYEKYICLHNPTNELCRQKKLIEARLLELY